MSGLLETITITLFLLMGLNAFSITHASTDLPAREELVRECPIAGPVNLRLHGNIKNGQLVGFINNESVFLSVFAGRVSGFIGNQSIMLNISNERNEYLLTGWIGTTHIRWTSFGGMFNEYIHC